MQKRQIESELKVRQKERVPSQFDTRLRLYGLHRRVQSEAFILKWNLNLELRVPYSNDAKSFISEAVSGKVANILAYYLADWLSWQLKILRDIFDHSPHHVIQFDANHKALIISHSTEDCAKRDFSFLFGKSAVLVPRPHQKYQFFDFELVKSNSTPTF